MHDNRDAGQPQRHRVERHARSMHAFDFFNLLTGPGLLDQVDEQLPPHRERLYPPIDTLSLFMAQTLRADASCQSAVDLHSAARVSSGLSPCSTNNGAYCKARQRLPQEMVHTLTRQTGALIAEQTPSRWRWQGRRVKLIDGTTVTMPDTMENQARYPQQTNQKPGLGFPIARLVGLLCMASGAILDTATGPYAGKSSSEHSLFHRLMDNISAGDLILADCYYCTYFIIALLQARGADVLFPQHQRRRTDFRKGQRIGAKDHIVTWLKPKIRPNWLSREQYNAAPETVTVRELKVRSKILVTTLLSGTDANRKALGDLYDQRWNIELDFRNIKTTLGLKSLRCRTPDMNEKQWWVGMLAYNLIRLLMLESAKLADVLPRQISFKHSVQMWAAWSPLGLIDDDHIDLLCALVAQRRVGDRPGRVEPRALKRRSNLFPLLMQKRETARQQIRCYGHPQKA